MLPLAATNAVGVLLFGALYAASGARWLSQAAFLICLAILFVLVVGLWLRVEARVGRDRDLLSRLGRIAAGLGLVVIAAPPATLMPLFWLESNLPPEAGITPALAPAMALVLIALVLTVLANLLGVLIAGARLVSRARRP